jgi:hypothetical protein
VWSNPTGIRPTGGRSEHAVSTRTTCSQICSLRSHHSTLARLAARSCFAARLACSAGSLRLPPCSPLLTCALASLAPAASPACFARLACRLLGSLDPPFPLLAPLVVSPAALPRFARAASPVCSLRSLPRQLCSRFARQLACCSLCSMPRLRLASLAAGCSACCSLRSPSTC